MITNTDITTIQTNQNKPVVSVIPATKRHLKNSDQFQKQTSLRVAAYCRVSTEEESQQGSYTAQKSYYTTLILSRPGWVMVNIYADEGKSGTSRKYRSSFNQMIQDARDGKIDYIITKSISRFARNTQDALECVHELQCQHPPVGIYFERENIDTLNANSEMFLTFYCMMAQEESHSISENIKWSIQKKFKSGKPQINLRRMLGYDQCKDGSWIINDEQAETVRYIYKRFLQGTSANAIAKELNTNNQATVNGGVWRADTVFNILRNEKYVGDLRMQKTYTESYLTHKSVPNLGEYPQYFLKNHHSAIVDRDTWNLTQALLVQKQRRGKHASKTIQTSAGEIEIGIEETAAKQKRGATPSPFEGLICGNCGTKMRRMTYNSTIRNYRDERSHEGKERLPGEEDFRDVYTFSYGIWRCPKSSAKKELCGEDSICHAITLTEASMEQSFMEMLYHIKHDYQLNGNNSEIIKSFQIPYTALCKKEGNSVFIKQKLDLLEMEIKELEENFHNACQKRETAYYAAGIALSKTPAYTKTEINTDTSYHAYAKLANDLKKRIEEKKAEKDQLFESFGVAQNMKQNFDSFLEAVLALPDMNHAGIKINVNALDADGSVFRTSAGQNRNDSKSMYHDGKLQITPEVLQTAPDYLEFNYYIFKTYILKIETRGDEIRYSTTFGLILTSIRNSRSINSFIGYRKSNEDGTIDMILESYQISKGKIQYHWRKKKGSNKIPQIDI